MTDHRANPLLDAVDDLTMPIRHGEQQDILENGKVIGQQKIMVALPPLLKQLDTSIRSTIGGASTSGASLAFEGAVLNTAALFTAMKISSQIRDWCAAVKVAPAKDSSTDLRAWYVAFTVNTPELAVENARIKQLTKWAAQIRTLLDPPREKDLPDPCPVCGATEWWDPKTGTKYTRPLIVRYRPSGADMIQEAKGMCRACETVWGVRELSYALEHPEGETA